MLLSYIFHYFHIRVTHFIFSSTICGPKEPVYQAVWADSSNFNEVLVSPTMVNDHMPDNVLDALEKVSYTDIQCI